MDDNLTIEDVDYPTHPAVAELLERWARDYPAVEEAARWDISSGDWDADDHDADDHDDDTPPPYTLAGQFEVAYEAVAEIVIEEDRQKRKSEGRWYVRMGLVDVVDTPGEQALIELRQLKKEAEDALSDVMARL